LHADDIVLTQLGSPPVNDRRAITSGCCEVMGFALSPDHGEVWVVDIIATVSELRWHLEIFVSAVGALERQPYRVPRLPDLQHSPALCIACGERVFHVACRLDDCLERRLARKGDHANT